MGSPHSSLETSQWVVRWSSQMRPRCTVLDLACGYGRHSRFFASLGHPVCAVDCDPDALASLSGQRRIHVLRVDLEGGAWPFAGQRFGGIVVTNYLHRPLLSKIVSALTDDGVLIYETFARGNERYGKPSNPAFLLEPGELLEAVHDRLRVVAFEDVFVDLPKPAMIQRICACGLHHAPAPQPV